VCTRLDGRSQQAARCQRAKASLPMTDAAATIGTATMLLRSSGFSSVLVTSDSQPSYSSSKRRKIRRESRVPDASDEIPEPMVIASLLAGPSRHRADHRPFAHPPQLLADAGAASGVARQFSTPPGNVGGDRLPGRTPAPPVRFARGRRCHTWGILGVTQQVRKPRNSMTPSQPREAHHGLSVTWVGRGYERGVLVQTSESFRCANC
jgi:hypothetical protein